MADQLTTTAKVKTRLNITDAVQDALISEIIDQISDEIAVFTRRKLVPDNAATYVFDTRLGHILNIPYGIRSVTSMGVAATDQPDDASGTYLAVTLSTILLRPLPVERRPGWPATQLRLTQSPIDIRIPFRTAAAGARIVGNFGFAATPPAVERIATDASVAEYLDRKRSGRRGAEGIDLPGLLGVQDLASLSRFRPGIGIG
jgi:Phage gp6-like head-tail connector protein